jgi:hypothetical protein
MLSLTLSRETRKNEWIFRIDERIPVNPTSFLTRKECMLCRSAKICNGKMALK